jgi:ribosomal protein S18 acetylase RimI-like enzyme
MRVGAWALRPVAASDADFLASLFRSNRPELAMLPAGLADTLVAQQQRWQEAGYRQAFPQAGSWIIVVDGIPAGKLVLDEQPRQLHVVDIAIAPASRRRGYATAVLAQLQREAAASGRDVTLSIAHENSAALRLYESLGFVGETRDAVRAALRWRAP